MSRILPEEAVALARCYLYRFSRDTSRPALGTFVPSHRACMWCEYPEAYLLSRIKEFNADAGFDSDRDRYADPQVEHFYRLPHHTQTEMIERQAYPEDAA